MPLQYTGIGRTLQLFTQQNTYQIKHPSNIPHFWKQKLGKHFSVQNTCKNKTCFKNIRHLATDMPMKFIGKWWKMNYFLILWIVISKILRCSYHCTEKIPISPFLSAKKQKGEMHLRGAWKKEKRPWFQAAVSEFLFGHQAKSLGQCFKCHCKEMYVVEPCGFHACFYRTNHTQIWYLGYISFFERSLSMNFSQLANYCLVHFWKHAISQVNSQMLTRLRSV